MDHISAVKELDRLKINARVGSPNPFGKTPITYRRTGGNIPALLTGGEYVMSPESVSKYGSGTMAAINRGSFAGFAEGGQVGEGVVEKSSSGNEINITVNITGEGASEYSATTGSETQGKEFANKIKSAVLEVIQQQKRVGGSLR